MLTRIVNGGLLGGFAAGLLAALLHLLLVQPVLLAAERYESGELVHQPAMAVAHDHDAAPVATEGLEVEVAQPSAPASSLAPSLAPTLDPGRDGLTVLSFGLAYAGFGLCLAAAMAVAETRGRHPATWRAGLAWGAAGWVALLLAPALGLPPELPGMGAADLAARQAWWWGTAAATALGLAALAFGRGWHTIVAGLALVAAPHVLGAPGPAALVGPAPPELAALFAARALGVGLVAWLALGCAVVVLRQDRAGTGRSQVA
jgi:cobalt transporter subunit CbtA